MTSRVSRRELIKLAAALSIAPGAAVRGETERAGSWRGRSASRRRPSTHFLLVHGAWHGAWCWYKISAALERAGHRVTALDLPGGGIDSTPPIEVTRQTQVDRVVAAIDAAREPVVLVGHSAGGPIVSDVAEARPDRIEKTVYVSAFLVPDGVAPVQIAVGDGGSHLSANLILHPERGSFEVRAEAWRDVFYNRSDDRDIALAAALLKPYPLAPLVPPMRLGAGFDRVRRFYVTCLRDHAISPAVQESMYTALPCEKVISIAESDHSPFFSHSRELLAILLEIARA